MGNNWYWRSGINEFCFGLCDLLDRKSLGGSGCNLLLAGNSIFGDIIRALCRLRGSQPPPIAESATDARRQNSGPFSFIVFVLGNNAI